MLQLRKIKLSCLRLSTRRVLDSQSPFHERRAAAARRWPASPARCPSPLHRGDTGTLLWGEPSRARVRRTHVGTTRGSPGGKAAGKAFLCLLLLLSLLLPAVSWCRLCLEYPQQLWGVWAQKGLLPPCFQMESLGKLGKNLDCRIKAFPQSRP